MKTKRLPRPRGSKAAAVKLINIPSSVHQPVEAPELVDIPTSVYQSVKASEFMLTGTSKLYDQKLRDDVQVLH